MQHVHSILEMINNSGKVFSTAELNDTIVAQFGQEARFSSCSNEDMNATQAIEFLVSRGKFAPNEEPSVCCGSCGG